MDAGQHHQIADHIEVLLRRTRIRCSNQNIEPSTSSNALLVGASQDCVPLFNLRKSDCHVYRLEMHIFVQDRESSDELLGQVSLECDWCLQHDEADAFDYI